MVTHAVHTTFPTLCKQKVGYRMQFLQACARDRLLNPTQCTGPKYSRATKRELTTVMNMELAHTRNIRHFPTRRLLCNKSRGRARGDPGCTLGDPGHPSGLCDTNVQNHDRPNGHSGALLPGTYTGTERAAPSETVKANIIPHDNRFSASIDAALGKKGKKKPGRPAMPIQVKPAARRPCRYDQRPMSTQQHPHSATSEVQDSRQL